MRKLSIVIPVYNAEKTIAALCEALIALYAAEYRLEIVLVNDYSRDGTDAVCRRLLAAHPEAVVYIRLAKNFGEHNALMAGLNHATGDICVLMDDDFQNPPEEVRALLDEIDKGYDAVYARYAQKRDHWFRNAGSRFHDLMATFVLKKPAGLYLSSFKAVNRFLVGEIIKYTGPDPYIDGIILRSTANIGSVPVRHSPRRAGRSGYTFAKLLSLWGNAVVNYSLTPLRIASFLGFCMTIAGLGLGGHAVVDLLSAHRPDPSDYEKLTSMIILLRGLQLLAIGVVGEYVGRIYLALNQDPQFVVREMLARRETSSLL